MADINLVSYLPFTRSVLEDLKGNHWSKYGSPQIISRSTFPFKVAQFNKDQYIETSMQVGGTQTFAANFWIFIPAVNSNDYILDIRLDSDKSLCWLYVLSSGRIQAVLNKNSDLSLSSNDIIYKNTSYSYKNKWVNITFSYFYSSSRGYGLYLDVYDVSHNSLSLRATWNGTPPISETSGTLRLGSLLDTANNDPFLISKFRLLSAENTYYNDFRAAFAGSTNLTFDQAITDELSAINLAYFDSYANINLATIKPSLRWYYKNIGTADDLLVSGTSLTNVSPSKSITSKAFYQFNSEKCFDIQASKEIYMLFDVYHGTYGWKAYERAKSTTGIIAQTSSVLIYSNGTNVGSIPHTINKLETYLLYMKSDSTNGVIEVYKDGEYKYRYIGNVNNGDDFSNLVLNTNGSDTVFSNVVISNQPVYDSDRWVGNYNTIQRTLSNETWTKEKNLKALLPSIQSMDLCGNTWTVAGTTPTIVTTNYLNGKATQFGQGYIYTNPPALRSNNFTIDFWEYIPSTVNGLTAQMVVIDGTDGTDTQCLYIGYHNGATVPSFWLGKGASSGWKYSKVIGTKIRDKWVHRAVVRYNDKIYAFENGQLYTSFDIEYNMYIDITGSSLFIGGFKRASGLYPGMLSEVRVYVGYAVWTENFTPPNQEDYFETYWYFNKPAPILNTNYNMFRSLINASLIWKYINPGYPDLCASSQYSGITYEPLDQESSVAITGTTNISLTNMKYITDDEIWIKWTVSHDVTIPGYSINIMNEDSEYITFYHQGIVGHFFSNVDNTDLFKQNDSQHHSFDVNNVPSGSYCILHVKSHITNGIIELFVNSDLGSIKVIQGNINAGKKFTKVNLQIDASYYSTEISNIIISTGQLTSSDKIASNLNPVQYTLTNDEEWRFAKYVLQSWMLFENSPTEDLCGNTWTAYNNPSIIDTDVLHGKALQLNSGQYLSMTNTISLGGDKDLTISGWYNMSTSSGTWASMFTFWQTANGGHIIKLSNNGNSKKLAWDFSLGTYALGTNIDNKLHHFAYVYQAETKKISIYIDGKRLIYGSEEISRYDYKLYLGKSNYSADKAYVGTINEFKVYDGYAEFTEEEFTPPIPQLVSNKLYYNKSTQTMKFEYFANVQVNIVNIADNINRTNMFLRDYIPLHNDLEDKVGNVNPDRSDDYAHMRAAETGDIIAIESVFTNNTLDFKKYAIIYSNNDRTEKAESRGYLSIPNINSLLNSKFILQAQLFDVKFYQTSNSLLTNTIFSIFGQGLEQILLMVGHTDHLLLQANVKKIYAGSYSLINNFQLTVIYDYDNLHIIISSINTNTGDTKLEIVYNIDLTQSQPNFSRNINEILFGSDTNTSMLNAIHYLSEIKIYQDFNPEVSSDVIDNYITYQFNNNEESVYFEFYANTQINSQYLKIISQAFNKKFLIDDWKVKDNPPSSFLITQDIVGSELSDNLTSADPLIPGGKYYQSPIKEFDFEFKSNKTLSIGKKILFTATFLVTKMYNITFYINSENYSSTIWINPQSNDGELQEIRSSENLGELSYINEDKVVIENNTIISIAIEIQNDSISLYMNHTLKATWNWQGILSLLFPNNTLNTTTFIIGTDYTRNFKLYIQRASLYDLPEGKNLMDISSDKISIISSSSSIDPPRIAIYHNNSTYYNKLVLPTDENASKIRIYHNDTVYVLSK